MNEIDKDECVFQGCNLWISATAPIPFSSQLAAEIDKTMLAAIPLSKMRVSFLNSSRGNILYLDNPLV